MTEAANSIIDLYRRHGATWAKARGTKWTEGVWLDRFIRIVRPGASVLDIGCGSGEPIAQHVCGQGHPVTGVDASPEMIALFEANLPGETTQLADMRSLNLGLTFGGLIAWDSFFHLTPEDQRMMFPVFRRHAAPEAPLLFTRGPAFGEAIGTLQGEPLYHASLDPGEYRRLLNQNGFEVVAFVAEDPACTGHSVWFAHRLAC